MSVIALGSERIRNTVQENKSLFTYKAGFTLTGFHSLMA